MSDNHLDRNNWTWGELELHLREAHDARPAEVVSTRLRRRLADVLHEELHASKEDAP